MKSVQLAAAMSCALLASSGCAGVKFYSDKALTSEAGLPIYAPKPHLLVVRTGAEDKPIEVSVIYLPDRTAEGTTYAKFEPGFFGSSNLTMALANGQLTTLGQQTDPKVAELLGSVSGMITAQAGADKLGAEAIKILADAAGAGGLEEQSGIPYSDIGNAAVVIATDIKARVAEDAWFLTGLTALDRNGLGDIAVTVDAAGKLLRDPTQMAQAANHIATLKQQAGLLAKYPKSGGSNSASDNALNLVNAWAAQLQGLVTKATPEPEPKDEADFELYEIKQANGEVVLYRVK